MVLEKLSPGVTTFSLANTNNSGPSSETTSVSSSVFNFVYVNGRRYQSDCFRRADYFMPNDEGEQDRLDLFHHMFLLLLGGKLYIAPLENPQKVLDVGTGTGIWAIDFAEWVSSFPQVGSRINIARGKKQSAPRGTRNRN